MKKLMMIAMMAAVGMASASEMYLYWDSAPTADPWTSEGRAFDYAYLRAVDQGGSVISAPIENYDSYGDGPLTKVWSEGESPSVRTEVPVFGKITEYSSSQYGFVVEAYLNDQILWTSGVSWYEDLLAGNKIWAGDPSAMSGDISVATFSVPEPTGALLLLLGVAGLSLRRKGRNANA